MGGGRRGGGGDHGIEMAGNRGVKRRGGEGIVELERVCREVALRGAWIGRQEV